MARIPAAIRYKNPGAMWPNPIATKWGSKRWVYLNDGTGQGGNGKGNKIAIFDSWVDGICAQLELWRMSKNYRNKPLAEAIRIWSGGNHVEAYLKYIIQRIPSMTRDTVMNDAFWQSPQGLLFLKVQAGHEAGRAIPAFPEDYVTAQKLVFSKTPAVKKTPVVIPSVSGTTTSVAANEAGFPIQYVVLAGVIVFLALIGYNVYRNYRKLKDINEAIEAATVATEGLNAHSLVPEAPEALPEKVEDVKVQE